MRGLILAAVLALHLSAGAGRAGPVVMALVANGVGFYAAVGAAYGAVAGIALRLGVSLLLTAAANALAGSRRPKAAALNRELQVPNSRPPYRFVYGHTRVYGSWVPCKAKGGILYGCMLLNSRPSAGNFKIYLDKRELTLTGDMYDFAVGAVATNAPFAEAGTTVKIWAGRGAQTGPPAEILADVPEFFSATDGWRGRTVIWLKLNRGDESGRSDRWPRVPPEVEVEGDWSLVWDINNVAQVADDPATWTYSANQALCLLDALRQNPIRRFRSANLMLTTFAEAAVIANEEVGRLALPNEPRYQCNGVVVWDGREITDQVGPLVDAGAGQLTRIGGKLGYVAGAWRVPVHVLTDVLEEGGIDLERWQPGRDVPTAFRATYTAPDRDWQDAELPAIAVLGAIPVEGSEEGIRELPLAAMVTSPTQAMRVQQIAARKAGAQKRLAVMLPPNAFNLVGGSTLTASLPTGFSRLDGIWEVTSMNPGLWVSDVEGGLALRIPVQLAEAAAAHFNWNHVTDQLTLVNQSFTPGVPPLGKPVSGSATAGVGQIVVQFTMPATGDITKIEFWVSLTNSLAAADILHSTNAVPGAVKSYTHTGLGAGATRYYFARTLGPNNRTSGFTASVANPTPTT